MGVAGWQSRPHDGLRYPYLPRAALSPNEMYAALVAVAGYVPLALSGEDYLELLPVAWRRITAEGIRLATSPTTAPPLDPYRGQPSAIAAQSGRWEVHYDPYDLSQVWVRPPPTGLVHRLPGSTTSRLAPVRRLHLAPRPPVLADRRPTTTRPPSPTRWTNCSPRRAGPVPSEGARRVAAALGPRRRPFPR